MFREFAAPHPSDGSWPVGRYGVKRTTLDYDPTSILFSDSVKIPEETLKVVPRGFSHTYVALAHTRYPSDPMVGHIGLALSYNPRSVRLGFTSGLTCSRSFMRILPVIPDWDDCTRCHHLCIVNNPSSPLHCHVGSARAVEESAVTLAFQHNRTKTFPKEDVAACNEGWWLAVQGPPVRSEGGFIVSTPRSARPFPQGRCFACQHVDGSSKSRPPPPSSAPLFPSV